MTAHAPLDRLAPRDFYRQLDAVREQWDGDEYAMAKRLVQLRRMFEHLPGYYYGRAQTMLVQLDRARIANGVPWHDALRQLGAIVTDWNNSRPVEQECDECGLLVRGHRRLLEHRYVVHGYEEVA